MTKQTGIILLVLAGLVFMAWGDRMLPPPASTASYRIRTSVTSALGSLFGQSLDSLPRDTRYDRTQERIDTFEQAP